MRKAERSFTGTPAEKRAIEAGRRAAAAVAKKGGTKAEAKKAGADAAEKAMKGSRSKFNKNFAVLAAGMAFPAIRGAQAAVRGAQAIGKGAKKGLDVSQKAVKKRLEQQRKQRIADRLKEDKPPPKDKKPKKLKRVEKIVRVALGQGEKGRRSGLAL